ncbi:MAG: PadR family transcriptional regulator [Gemmatimonadetes bacterium]|nr:PadR family transcriptional regulator [Gemmatimonadota bacterium]
MSGSDLFTGTLDMLVLQSLEAGPRHGYAVGKWLRDHSGGVLSVGEGALYPALHRLQTKGYLTSAAGRTETGRKAKFYRLTPMGQGRLETEAQRWKTYSHAVASLMGQEG